MDYFNIVLVPYVFSFIIGMMFFVFSIFEKNGACLLNKSVSREKMDVFFNLPFLMRFFVFFVGVGSGGILINLVWYLITDHWFDGATSLVFSLLPALFFGNLLSIGIWEFWPYVMTKEQERETEVIGNVAEIKSMFENNGKTFYQAEIISRNGQLIKINIGSDIFDEKFKVGEEVIVFDKRVDGFYLAKK